MVLVLSQVQLLEAVNCNLVISGGKHCCCFFLLLIFTLVLGRDWSQELSSRLSVTVLATFCCEFCCNQDHTCYLMQTQMLSNLPCQPLAHPSSPLPTLTVMSIMHLLLTYTHKSVTVGVYIYSPLLYTYIISIVPTLFLCQIFLKHVNFTTLLNVSHF